MKSSTSEQNFVGLEASIRKALFSSSSARFAKIHSTPACLFDHPCDSWIVLEQCILDQPREISRPPAVRRELELGVPHESNAVKDLLLYLGASVYEDRKFSRIVFVEVDRFVETLNIRPQRIQGLSKYFVDLLLFACLLLFRGNFICHFPFTSLPLSYCVALIPSVDSPPLVPAGLLNGESFRFESSQSTVSSLMFNAVIITCKKARQTYREEDQNRSVSFSPNRGALRSNKNYCNITVIHDFLSDRRANEGEKSVRLMHSADQSVETRIEGDQMAYLEFLDLRQNRVIGET